MQKYPTKCIRIYDMGLFCSFAQRLAEDFGRVEYFSPWAKEFPRERDKRIGKGLPGVHRIFDFWDGLDEVDRIWFPDVHCGDIAVHLRDIFEKLPQVYSAKILSSFYGENYELFRDWSKKQFKKMGLPIGPYEVVKGTDALRKFIKDHPGWFVKMDITRGDCESFDGLTLLLINDRLVQLESDLGGIRNNVEFICEEPIKAEAEGGYDGICIGGQFPATCLCGHEYKDKSYFGVVTKYDKLPERIRNINDKLAPHLKKVGYQNFFSTEERDGKLIDLCTRLGDPPNGSYQVNIENVSELIYEGADGKLVEPEWKHKFVGQVFMFSPWADLGKWQAISFPEKYAQYIRLRKATRIEGQYYVIPTGEHNGVLGSIAYPGDDRGKIKETIKEIADSVKGHGIEIRCEDLDKAEEGLLALMADMK